MAPTLTAPSAGSTATSTASTPEKYPFFPDNIEFWFEAKRAFGAASYGSSEFGEVMASLNRITSGDYESWYNEWNATAERISAEADAQLAAGHRVSARDGYLRAANYFRTSEFFLHGNHEDPRIYSAYKKSIRAYKLSASSLTRLFFRWRFLTRTRLYPATSIVSTNRTPSVRSLFSTRASMGQQKKCTAKAHGLVSSVAGMSWSSTAQASTGRFIVSACLFVRIGRRSSPRWLTSHSLCLALIRKRLPLWASALGAISHRVPQLLRSESRPLSPTTESTISASLSWHPFHRISGTPCRLHW
jgi:hypothetical protein